MAETILTLLIFAAIFWGDDIMDLLRQLVGRPKAGLSKRQVKKLQREHTEAVDILREIAANDRYAVSPLPTDINTRLTGFLDKQSGRAALPPREDV